MAEHKYNTGDHGESHPRHNIEGPLFDEEPLDLDVHGGLVVLDTGQIAEVTPTRFIPEGGDHSLDGPRVQTLPFHVVNTGEGRHIVWQEWRDEPYDPERVTIGFETETLTMEASNAHWWNISEDGLTIRYPHALAEEPAAKRGHQPELLKNTTESGSPVENLSHGYEDFKNKAGSEKYNKQVWMVENGLMSVPLSVYPESVRDEDITAHPYTQMLKNRLMPHVLEYAACLSEQINIQWKNPEAGAFALNAYEILGPVLGLVTAASPARDGSLYTTLSQHYEDNPDFAAAPNAEDYEQMAALVRKELEAFMDEPPYDWRELARGYGSPSGGVINQPAPADLETFLREGDRQLRASEAMTINRTLGTHANRWRPDKGVVEISNLSLGGDHPDKMAAVEEMAIKTVIALQEYHDDPEAEAYYDDSWEAIIPRPHERNNMYSRKRFVDVARVNTMLFTVFGKERKMFDADWQPRKPREIFDAFADFVDRYAPEPLSEAAREEIQASLKRPPVYENSLRSMPQTLPQAQRWVMGAVAKALRYSHVRAHTINDPLSRFFEKKSNMTASEALRLAEPLDDMDPPITLPQLARRFAGFAYRKRLERHDALTRFAQETDEEQSAP